MTKPGIAVILLWILSLVGITFYGGPVSYGFFAAVTLIPVISLIYILIVLIRFKIYQDVNKVNVVAGNVTKFYITLQNEDFFTYSGIKLNFYSPFSSISGIDESTEYELMPFSGIKKETSLLCRYRGEYEVGIKSVRIRDFFRLFSVTYRIREPFRVNVLPQIIDLYDLKSIGSTENASRETHVNPSGPDVALRDYAPGDEMKMINWKASASAGKLLVRNQVGEEKQGIGIIMDSGRYSDLPEEFLPVENKISEAVIALALYFMRNNTSVTTYSYSSGLKSHTVRDNGSFRKFYTFLSGFRFEKENTNDRLFAGLKTDRQIHNCKMVFMVLCRPDESTLTLATTLIQNNTSVIVYPVTGDREEADRMRTIHPGNVIVISPEDDIREVL